MAGWGTGSFENEDAQAWLKQIVQLTADDLKSLLSGADTGAYLEAPESSVVIAAAEAVAALSGSPSDVTPRALVEWAEKNKTQFTPAVSALAIRAVRNVRTNSELKDLWLQADGLNEWSAALRDLETRLDG
jgi:hypothetical protein